jgi:DNA replication and repair protein RecF
VRLAGLELTAFRSWATFSLALEDGASVIVGPNGSGKTSLLEAAWYLASLSSHRVSSDAALIRTGEEVAIVRASVDRAGRTQKVELEIRARGRARARLGGAPVGRRRDVLGTLRASLFAPERLAVVRGDPGDRRRFVDELLVQLAPRYDAVIREYERALRQRNTLLKEHAGARTMPAGIEAWDEALSGPGGELCAGRASVIARLAPEAERVYREVGGVSLSVAYQPNVADPGGDAPPSAWTRMMRERLEERREDELVRGVTLVGPHRDDLALEINKLPARAHASFGESWLVALSLVLGGHAALRSTLADDPVLLLDDPFTPLDPARREQCAAALPDTGQILLTAADPAEVPKSLPARTIEVGA